MTWTVVVHYSPVLSSSWLCPLSLSHIHSHEFTNNFQNYNPKTLVMMLIVRMVVVFCFCCSCFKRQHWSSNYALKTFMYVSIVLPKHFPFFSIFLYFSHSFIRRPKNRERKRKNERDPIKWLVVLYRTKKKIRQTPTHEPKMY